MSARISLLPLVVAMVAIGHATIAHASAADGVYVRVETEAVAPEGEKSVRCDAGDRAIGGGAVGATFIRVSGPQDETGTTADTTTGDVPRYWNTQVFVFSQDRIPVDFYAICSTSSDATLSAVPVSANGNSLGTGFAFCPSGQRVIGGGVGETQSLNDDGLALSGPLDETGLTANTNDGDVAAYWYVAIFNLSLFDPHSYKVYAICSATSTATIEATLGAVPAGGSASVQATCPAGERVLSGGFNSLQTPNQDPNLPHAQRAQIHSSGPVSGTPATGWTVGFASASAMDFRVMAICERPAPAGGSTGGGDTGGGTGGGDSGGGEIGAGDGTGTTPPLCAQTAATIVGTEGTETIQGTPGADVIVGLGGDDRIRASAGNDVVCAGAGNDVVKGGGGTDLLFGEVGKDSIAGGPGRDSCYGGKGRDSNSCEKGRA